MRLYRNTMYGTGYKAEVNGKERFVESIVIYDENGPIISTAPMSMADNWPREIILDGTDIVSKCKLDFGKNIVFAMSTRCPGFEPRLILYIPASIIGLSEPVFTKSMENMCFVEKRTTNIDGFFFRQYHFFNRDLLNIEDRIREVGKEVQSGEWKWDEKKTLNSLIENLNKLSKERDAELERISKLTEEDIRNE